MDCRASRVTEGTRGAAGRAGVWRRWAGRLALVLGPALALGCVQQGALPLVPQAGGDPTAAQDSQLPRRKPKTNTVIAAGGCLEAEAQNPKHSDAEKAEILDAARRAYQQALKQDPRNVEAARKLATVYLREGEQERAMATLQPLLKKYPKNAGVWFDLAMVEAAQRNYGPAIQHMAQALTLDPENRAYGIAYGHLLARSGHYDESLQQFTRLVGPAVAHYKVAQMQQHLGQTELALLNLQQALQADPNLAEARQMMAALAGGGAPPAGAGPAQVGFEE